MKKWWQSKTIWLNIIATSLAAIQSLQGEVWISPALQAVLLAVFNISLRLITSKPVIFKTLKKR